MAAKPCPICRIAMQAAPMPNGGVEYRCEQCDMTINILRQEEIDRAALRRMRDEGLPAVLIAARLKRGSEDILTAARAMGLAERIEPEQPRGLGARPLFLKP